jgi:hypothetical protein
LGITDAAMKIIALLIPLVLVTAPVFAKDPDCSGVNNWATSMAFAHLKNAGLTDNDKVDFTKTMNRPGICGGSNL